MAATHIMVVAVITITMMMRMMPSVMVRRMHVPMIMMLLLRVLTMRCCAWR